MFQCRVAHGIGGARWRASGLRRVVTWDRAQWDSPDDRAKRCAQHPHGNQNQQVATGLYQCIVYSGHISMLHVIVFGTWNEVVKGAGCNGMSRMIDPS